MGSLFRVLFLSLLVLTTIGLKAQEKGNGHHHGHKHERLVELQASDVPLAVTQKFNKQHANPISVKWLKTPKSNYKVVFKNKNGMKVKEVYNEKGKKLVHKRPLKNVPSGILNYVNSNYSGFHVKKCVWVKRAGKEAGYIVKLNKEGQDPLSLKFNKEEDFVKKMTHKECGVEELED